MRSRPDGTREYDLMTIGPPPDWWSGALWQYRQLAIRRAIRAMFRGTLSGGPTRLDFVRALSEYDRREVEHALAAMVADHLLDLAGNTYSPRWLDASKKG